MTILFFFFKFQKKKRIRFYKLSFCFFYFSYIPRIPTQIPNIPTPFRAFPASPPRSSVLLPRFPLISLLFPAFLPPFPAFPSFRSSIPHSGFNRLVLLCKINYNNRYDIKIKYNPVRSVFESYKVLGQSPFITSKTDIDI